MDIAVISSDTDGADLRRKKRSNPYHARCDGKHDEQEINEAIDRSLKGGYWTISNEAYERIFGGK